MVKTFPYNPVMQSMEYRDELLSVSFIKKGKIEKRTYSGVPIKTAYEWFYKDNIKDILSYYAKNIRKKFELIDIKLI